MAILSRQKNALWLGGVLAATLLLGVAGLALSPDAAAPPPNYEKEVRPLLDTYCAGCHGGKSPSAGINLEKAAYPNLLSVQKAHGKWQTALTQVRDHAMPPKGMPQPTDAERALMVSFLRQTLDNLPETILPNDPGRTVVRRLSRLEYNNTIRDLLGVNTRPADNFPADGSGGGGFDNNADTLFLPPILMERYLEAAQKALQTAKPEQLFAVRPGKNIPARVAAQKSLTAFLPRAFRRPVQSGEIAPYLGLYEAASKSGKNWENAMRFALKGVLVSPQFLFRIEQDQPGPTGPYPVGDYELASRLSYFLWASMPDETLLSLAKKGTLRDPKILDQQVARMLKSSKAAAFGENFASQWLRIRELKTTANPDPNRYPSWSPELRDAMYSETVLFFQNLLSENRPLTELIDADYTFVNETLAKHYGIANIAGSKMRRVALADKNRGGVLCQASVLTVTSYPQRTSPVLRGKWVLEEIFGTPAPPPPANVKTLPPDDAPQEGLTFRQRLEKHREDPNCASCHVRMDPVGFGLENFDAIGQWRTVIGDQAVDSSGVLATGENFTGPAQLKTLLLKRQDVIARNLTERMLSYALGRGILPADSRTVKQISDAVAKDGYKTQTLITQIVHSYPFRYRKSDAPTAAAAAAVATAARP